MITELLTRERLILLNKSLRYPLAIAEKDYFLAIVSKIIFDSELSNSLIFKGGTALHHVYLPQLRFSEDLDFSSNATKLEIDQVRDIFSSYDFLKIKKDYSSKATIKIEKLQYLGPLLQPNFLKVEIDFLQKVILPPIEVDYSNNYGVITKVRAMDIVEITAEKIRAMSDRIRYRDFYDFVMIVKKLAVDLDDALSLVRKKEVRSPISRDKILSNWSLAQQEKQQEITNIYYTEELVDQEIEEELKKLKFNIIY